MPIVNYVREHIRFMEYATDEHIPASERLLWYALMHIMNQRAQGNIWPDEFIRISNDRLLSYCPMKFDTMASARNGLKQRGLIEFTRGEKNKLSPAYRMIYFYPQYIPPETMQDGEGYPKKTDNIGGNIGYNMGSNMGGKPGGNLGDFNINYTDTATIPKGNPGETHTETNYGRNYPASRESGYTGLEGEVFPCRYDSAWQTSERARSAVAQRVMDKLPFPIEDCPRIHERLTEFMDYGMPPELMEDMGNRTNSTQAFLYRLDRLAEDRDYTKDAQERRRCLRAANGNTELAARLYRISHQEDNGE